jgi:hypothetical protein
VAGIFLLACIGVGLFVFSRERNKPPVRYRSVVTVQIAPGSGQTKDKSSSKIRTTTTRPPIVLVSGGVTKLALSTTTRTAALRGAHLAPNTNAATIGFSAGMLSDDHFIALTVTTPNRTLASSVAKSWGVAFSTARKESAKQQVQAEKRALLRQQKALQLELRNIDGKLAKLLPGIYGGVLRYDRTSGHASVNSGSSTFDPNAPPQIPDTASPFLVNIALERPQLIKQITDLGQRAAEILRTNVTPDAFAQVVLQTPPKRVTKTRSVTVPGAAGLLGGLALGIGAAVLVDRRDRRIRDPRAAATAFAAPVLSLVPFTTHSDYVVLADPLSNTAEAYRGLAATSIATDRLPKAIMVSTPHGDAHEEVAANYAAALSWFGLKVALIATNPDQAWYAERFDSSGRDDHAGATFPELLAAAHAGTLNGQVRDGLARDERVPNLVVVPPSDEAPVRLPVDGLPPLLQALADAGTDIVVISGPALLEDADATIVAWATRCVLWAIVEGEITSNEARAAAARLELAGVVPFGVVMVGHRSNGI